MAEATSQLQRIADLVQRAGTIAGKQRGMRIEADDWNTMVDIVLGVLQIDRLQEQSQAAQLEQRFALRDHEHLGEVNVAWLEPSLQTGLDGKSGVSTRQALADMDRKIVAVQEQMAKLQATLEAHQRQLDRAAVDEIGRAKTLRDFETRFESVSNIRTAVQTVATEVGTLRTTFDQVLELRKSLTDVDGTVIDVGKVRRDVADLQSLRESLTGIDGKPLSLRELETRIAEIADVVGVGNDGGLEKRLTDGFSEIEFKLSEETEARLTESLAAITAENVALESRLRTLVESTRTETVATAAANSATAVATLDARLTAALAEQFSTLSTATTKGLDSVRDELDRRMAEVPEIARTAADTAATTMGESVTRDVEGRITAQTTAQIADSEGRLGSRLTGLQSELTSVHQGLPALVGAAVRDATGALDSTLTTKLSAGVAAAEQRLQTMMPAQVTVAVNASLANLDARIGAAVVSEIDALEARIDQGVTAAVKDIDTQIVGEVERQLAAADVDGRISAAVKESSQALHATIAAELADQQARLSTSIASTASTLQAEFGVAVQKAVATSQKEIFVSLDDRLSNVDTLVARSVSESFTTEFKLASRTIDERVTKIEAVLAMR
jgi:hypothetical protein